MNQERICIQKVFHKTDYEKINKIYNSTSKNEFERLSAAFYSEKLWEFDKVIKIKFLNLTDVEIPITSLRDMDTTNGEPDPIQIEIFDKLNNGEKIDIKKEIINIVKQRIEPLTTLTFQFLSDSTPNQMSDVRISMDPDNGSWSLLGTDALKEDKNEPTMNFAWFDVGTVMHEFGHLLGLIHEHQNPLGTGINWNKKIVYDWANETQGWDKETTDKNILDKYDRDEINGSDFDPLSIMLYFFPGNLTNDNKGTHQNLRLSGNDMKYITKTYGKENADSFYTSIYDSNIDKNIEESKILREEKRPLSLLEKIGIFAIVVLIIVAIIYYIKYYSNSKIHFAIELDVSRIEDK